MNTPCGSPRKLSDGQIVKVLKWHQEAIDFRRSHGTLRDLARLLGVSLRTARACFEVRHSAPAINRRIPTHHARGKPGRPRRLNPAEIAFAVAWRHAGRQFRAQHGSVARLAHQLGVGASTIHDCIRRKGRYTQATHIDLCKAGYTRRGHLPVSDNALRAALLRAWVKGKP